ncbi:hypothetical protein, partial [Pseudomonas savastanoi]|uniref:hypothetical protein n=1 Tax=Pseudomonas savastanoi TaxID=29438 RepID=UPI001C80DDC7
KTPPSMTSLPTTSKCGNASDQQFLEQLRPLTKNCNKSVVFGFTVANKGANGVIWPFSGR